MRLSKLRKRGLASAPRAQISASASERRDGADAQAPSRRGDRRLVHRLRHVRASPPLAHHARREHDDRVFVHRFARHFADNAAVPHDDDAVADADQLGHLRRDHDHRPALRRERGDEAIDLLLGADVDSARRLVDDDDARIELHHFREQQLLLVAARHLAGKEALVADPDVEALESPRRAPALPWRGRPAARAGTCRAPRASDWSRWSLRAAGLCSCGPRSDRRRRRACRLRASGQRCVAPSRRISPPPLRRPNSASNSSVRPAPTRPGEAENFARPHAEARRPPRSPAR